MMVSNLDLLLVCLFFIIGDTVGVDLSVFESSLPVVLFSKNYHPIGLRYLMANDTSQYFPTIALCGNGYEVVIDVFWHNRLCVGPTFDIVSKKIFIFFSVFF
jgi:hypothetical protein